MTAALPMKPRYTRLQFQGCRAAYVTLVDESSLLLAMKVVPNDKLDNWLCLLRDVFSAQSQRAGDAVRGGLHPFVRVVYVDDVRRFTKQYAVWCVRESALTTPQD